MEIISVRVGSPSQAPNVNVENPSQVNVTLENVNIQTGGTANNAVLYDPQDLTDAQKQQARENINAAGKKDVDELSEEINGGIVEIFYTETGEEHYWEDTKTLLCFDLLTPLVAGNKYEVTIAGTTYTVAATEGIFDTGDKVYDCVELSSGDGWKIRYSEEFKEIDANWLGGYNTFYYPPEDYYREVEDFHFDFIPHSLKIEQKRKSLKEIAESTVELDITYEDGTTATLMLYGEVKS